MALLNACPDPLPMLRTEPLLTGASLEPELEAAWRERFELLKEQYGPEAIALPHLRRRTELRYMLATVRRELLTERDAAPGT